MRICVDIKVTLAAVNYWQLLTTNGVLKVFCTVLRFPGTAVLWHCRVSIAKGLRHLKGSGRQHL